MTDTLIEFETAKLAKEKGFALEAYPMYSLVNKKTKGFNSRRYAEGQLLEEDLDETCCDTHTLPWEDRVSAPTQSLLQKWLREEKEIHIEIIGTYGLKSYRPTICYVDEEGMSNEDTFYLDTKDTYEQALEEGLRKALELI